MEENKKLSFVEKMKLKAQQQKKYRKTRFGRGNYYFRFGT